MEQLLIPTNKGTKILMPENIIRIEANSNYCKIYLDNGYPITVAKVLHWFEEKLPNTMFYRIHRTHIINRMFISEISMDHKLILVNGENFQVSRRKKNTIRLLCA